MKFTIKKIKLLTYDVKPKENLNLYINFVYKKVKMTDIKKNLLILYKIDLLFNENKINRYKIIYNRNNITVYLSCKENDNKTKTKLKNPNILFYSYNENKSIFELILKNKLNKNKYLYWNKNIYTKLFNILHILNSI